MATAIDDPTKLNTTTDPNALTSSTLPVAKPASLTPTAPSTQPVGTSQPSLPLSTDPMATTDPMAFQPPPGSIPNTQNYIAGTSTPTTPGTLGYQYVPGSNNGLIDLGGGNVAPTVNGQSTLTDLGSTPAGVSLDANGYPIWTATGQPWTGQDQQNLLASKLTGASPYTGQGYTPTFSGPSAATGAAPTNGLPAPTTTPRVATDPLYGGVVPGHSANGAGTPSSGLGLSMPAGSPGGSPAPGSSGTNPGQGGTLPNSFLPAQSASELANNGYNLTPTTPQNALTNSTITPGPGTDRYAIAKQQLADFTAQSEPAYQAALRDANRYNFSSGRGVSGIANNSIGDLQLQRENAVRSQGDQFLSNALTGSIEDAYRNIGIAEQQQGFQAGQQQTAFGQNYATQQLGDQEKKDAFSQALQQWMAGTSNDPSQTALYLAQIFGGNPSQFYNLLTSMKGQAPTPTNPTTPQTPTPAGAG